MVQVHCNDETRHMIGAEQIAKMKDGIRIINLARGELVDDEAMIAAIDSGKVARYVTDFPNDRLVGVANVVAMPHLGASTPESEEKCAVMAARELADYLYNGNVKNGVNLPNVHLERAGVARICVIHKNVPRMINRFLDLIGGENINVEHMINKPRGGYACTIVDLGEKIGEDTAESIRAMSDVLRVRIL
jgi:D-3-phosphoglycerate dehydrogenase